MKKYRVIFTGQGAGYNTDDIIYIPDSVNGMKDIAWEVNRHAKLSYTDLGLLAGTEDKMSFGTRMDGITFRSIILIIEKI